MKKILLGLLILGLAGCQRFPKLQFEWPDSKLNQRIAQLEEEKEEIEKQKGKLQQEYSLKIEKAKEGVVESERNRFSAGTAQVYAASSTLEANPVQDKYTVAANDALGVSKEALPTPNVEDLLLANKIQSDLLSEQAERIKNGEEQLGIIRTEVIAAKNKEDELKRKQEELEKEQKRKEEEWNAQILAKEEEAKKNQEKLEKERLEWAARENQLANKYREDNTIWKKLNPFDDLGRFFSSIFWWIVVIVIIGGILKILSIFFPQVNILQKLVSGAGKVIGSVFGMLFRWVPHALDGLGAVDEKQFATVQQIMDNSIGSIQNFRDENPDLYQSTLKKYLEDWNKDYPKLKTQIEKRLKELNVT